MSPIKEFYSLSSKIIRYIPEKYKPFKCDIKGRYEIVMGHGPSDDPAIVKIFRGNDKNYSEYFLVDEGKDYNTTYPILERKRVMTGIN